MKMAKPMIKRRSSTTQALSYRESIPTLEIIIYWTFWLGCCIYSTICVYLASRKYARDMKHDFFLRSSFFPGAKRKDQTDWEWKFWSGWSGRLFTFAMVHVVVSLFTPRRWHRWIQPLITIGTLLYLIGYQLTAFIFGHFIVMHIIVILTGSSMWVWITSVAMLASLNNRYIGDKFYFVCEDLGLDVDAYYIILLLLSIKNLQLTSAALTGTAISGNKEDKKLYTFIDMVHYGFYIPIFFSGPFVSFDQFKREQEQPATVCLWDILKLLGRVSLWAFFYEMGTHYFYCSAFQMQIEVLEKIDMWALAGNAFLVGNFFMVKYVVLYGVPTLLLRLDGITPPPLPKCVSMVYYYSEMWKTFDAGLYVFIKKYIYVPLGGSQYGLVRQLFASFMCFTFIYFWHGAEHYLLVWVYINFAGVAVEAIAKFTASQMNVSAKLSPAWTHRLQAAASTPLYLLQLVGVYTFLGSSVDVGITYARRLLWEGWPVSTGILLLSLYCCINVVNHIYDKGKTDKVKNE